MTAPVLSASSLTREFGDDTAVAELDLVVASGEIHAIVGLNGAGKTTLMRLLLGMLRPTLGSAKLLGQEAMAAPPHLFAKVGYLIETPFAYNELTVRENLRSAALLHGVNSADLTRLVDSVVDGFELNRWVDRRAGVLSLGNRQRLGLASSFVHEPSVLVLDEPANALDPAGVVFIRELLRERAEAGAAILVSSHHLDQVARIADRITVLHRGRRIGRLDPTGFDLETLFFEQVYEADRRQGRAA